jgi:AcrR family transcriptional regulator
MEDVTVTAIARRSSLSPATVYNLFGSKGAILSRVFDLDLLAFEARVAQAASADGLDRIFDAIAIASQLYRHDPSFYRLTMVARVAPGQKSGFESTVREPRMLFWRRLVREAIDDGGLAAGTDAEALSVLLVQIVAGVLIDWASDAISVDQLEAEMNFGFAAVLASFAARPSQARLRRRLKDWRRTRTVRPRAA